MKFGGFWGTFEVPTDSLCTVDIGTSSLGDFVVAKTTVLQRVEGSLSNGMTLSFTEPDQLIQWSAAFADAAARLQRARALSENQKKLQAEIAAINAEPRP